jgi:hypothetical protein
MQAIQALWICDLILKSVAIREYIVMQTSWKGEQGGPFILSAGWLFADLLLALGMLFMISNTFAIRKPNIPPPILKVSPASLDPNNTHCMGGSSAPRCTITIEETPASLGSVDWSVKSDMSTAVVFSTSKGSLTPGKSMSVTISGFPCQNGSFIFSGSKQAMPVIVPWHCTLPPQRLDFHFQEFMLNVQDAQKLLNDDSQAISDIKQQVRNKNILHNRSVGLAIVYGGAPDDTKIGQAQNIANKIYAILNMLGQEGFAFQKASYYDPLFTLGADPTVVKVDVYLFQQ